MIHDKKKKKKSKIDSRYIHVLTTTYKGTTVQSMVSLCQVLIRNVHLN